MNAFQDDNIVDIVGELLESSDEDEDATRKHGGSRPGKAANIDRSRQLFAESLHRDYFSSDPVYPAHLFERRFRLTRDIFVKIVDKLQTNDRYFVQRKDCTGTLGLNAYQKCTAAMRMLAYGGAADAVDEYVRLAESTCLEALQRFCEGVVYAFGSEFLRSPSGEDMKAILSRGNALNFPGMIGSIDCSKWRWKNCPTAHHGQHIGKEGVPTITIEAVSDERLWIWHLFFGMPGCNNDVNVFEASTLFNKIAEGTFPVPVQYKILDTVRNKPYFLSDGIYPKSPLFVQSILNPTTEDERYFASRQEGRRKDVERAFGVLQAKFHVLERSCRLWSKEKMGMVMRCCTILHNMMVEERDEEMDEAESEEGMVDVSDEVRGCYVRDDSTVIPPPGSIAAMSAATRYIHDASEYMRTRELVIAHVLSARKK